MNNNSTTNAEKNIRTQLVEQNTLLRPVDVSKMLDVSIETLSVWRSTKKVNLKFIKVGRSVRYRLSDVLQFIAENTN